MMLGSLLAVCQGLQGIPLPYNPRMDDGLTVVLLTCFFMSAYVLSRSRKFLLQLAKDFLLNRERTSIFATSTSSDMRYLLLLIFQTCVMGGVCIFNYFCEVNPVLLTHVQPFPLLGIYIGVSLLFIQVPDYRRKGPHDHLPYIFFDRVEGHVLHALHKTAVRENAGKFFHP